MALRIGQTLRGAWWNYRLGNHTVLSEVFKAEEIPRVESKLSGKRAAIKSSSKGKVLDALKHEHTSYLNLIIRSSRHIRAMYEAINTYSSRGTEEPLCLAFEWMDYTLKEVRSASHRKDPVFYKTVASAVLGALDVLKSQQLVHTDIKHDNILISGLNGPSPLLKLGDLGLLQPEGFKKRLTQSFAMRAHELWSGVGCFHASDVWAFAVTLFDRISPYVFGINDIPPCHWPQPWAMAKLMRLFPGSLTGYPTNPDIKGYFSIATLIDNSGMRGNTDAR